MTKVKKTLTVLIAEEKIRLKKLKKQKLIEDKKATKEMLVELEKFILLNIDDKEKINEIRTKINEILKIKNNI